MLLNDELEKKDNIGMCKRGVGAGVGVGGSQAGSAEKPGGKVRKERGGESESSSDSDSSDSSDSR